MTVRAFFAELFKSPADRHREAVQVFRDKGFRPGEAERAATALWIACRSGQRTPQWIMERLEELRA